MSADPFSPDGTIEPGLFRFFSDDYCRPVSYQFERLPYQPGCLDHCYSLDNNFKLYVNYYEVEDGTISAGSRRYRKCVTVFDLNDIYYWINEKVKPKIRLTISPEFVETVKTFLISTMNHNFHISVNDFRVEGDFLRIKLNPYYIPNSQLTQFFFLTIDSALAGAIRLLQSGIVLIVLIIKNLPIPYLANFKDLKPTISLYDFINAHYKKTGSIFTLKNTQKTLDYTNSNYIISNQPSPSPATPIVTVAIKTPSLKTEAKVITATATEIPIETLSQSTATDISAVILTQLSQNSCFSLASSSSSSMNDVSDNNNNTNNNNNHKEKNKEHTKKKKRSNSSVLEPGAEMFALFRYARQPDLSGLINDPGDGTIYVRSSSDSTITYGTFQYYTPNIDRYKKQEEIQNQYNQAFIAAQQFIIQQAAAAKSLS